MPSARGLPRPIRLEREPVDAFPLRFQNTTSRSCTRWQHSPIDGTALCAALECAGAQVPRSGRHSHPRTRAGQPYASPRRPVLRATLPTAFPACRETSDNSPPAPPSQVTRLGLCSRFMRCRGGARNHSFRAEFRPISVRETYVFTTRLTSTTRRRCRTGFSHAREITYDGICCDPPALPAFRNRLAFETLPERWPRG